MGWGEELREGMRSAWIGISADNDWDLGLKGGMNDLMTPIP